MCSNPVCRADLAFCSHCYDITTYTLAEPAPRPALTRDRYRCGRCQRLGVKCVTWVAGGYCNGLARATEKGAATRQACTNCSSRATEVGRTILGWSVIGALGGFIKPRK